MKHTVDSAIASLKRNRVRVQGREIYLSRTVGIKLWGRIDFLVNYCEFTINRGE